MSHPHLFSILDLLRSYGVRAALISDGGLIGPQEAQRLARYDLARVQITLLSSDRDLHDALKGLEPGSPSALDQSLRALALLRREGVPVSVSFVCMRQNAEHLEEVLRLCRALGVQELAFSRLCTLGEAQTETIWASGAQVQASLEALPKLSALYKVQIHNAVAIPHCLHPTGGGCGLMMGRPNYSLDPRGWVRPCSLSPRHLGHISEGWEIVQLRYHQQLLPQLRQELPLRCQRCEALPRCGGGCRESAQATGGLDPLIV